LLTKNIVLLKFIKNCYVQVEGKLDKIKNIHTNEGVTSVQRQYKQEKQMQMNDKALIKDDNRVFRVQNPIRQELSLSVFDKI
jgi:hypothetical protein